MLGIIRRVDEVDLRRNSTIFFTYLKPTQNKEAFSFLANPPLPPQENIYFLLQFEDKELNNNSGILQHFFTVFFYSY